MVTKVTLWQKAFLKLTKITTKSYLFFIYHQVISQPYDTTYNTAFSIGRKFPIGKKYFLQHL